MYEEKAGKKFGFENFKNSNKIPMNSSVYAKERQDFMNRKNR